MLLTHSRDYLRVYKLRFLCEEKLLNFFHVDFYTVARKYMETNTCKESVSGAIGANKAPCMSAKRDHGIENRLRESKLPLFTVN